MTREPGCLLWNITWEHDATILHLVKLSQGSSQGRAPACFEVALFRGKLA